MDTRASQVIVHMYATSSFGTYTCEISPHPPYLSKLNSKKAVWVAFCGVTDVDTSGKDIDSMP
ncbi:hypothetical protein E2C01_029781 [Portunus trituberculatus]|uniref:Uncharacterized protein n=1 Tax=Portunus trituberculatus TaxID=210409 RepID=A0A5B7ET55_PORTR|nr:hypothetical protein [Portunus trituberculatus]